MIDEMTLRNVSGVGIAVYLPICLPTELRTKCHYQANKLATANPRILIAARPIGDREEGPEILTRREETERKVAEGKRRGSHTRHPAPADKSKRHPALR